MKFALKAAGAIAIALAAIRLWPHPPLRDSFPGSAAVYARDGELLRLGLAADGQYRLWVPLSDIDPRLPRAVQLYEDRWFYWHPGVNPMALVRAAAATYAGGSRQGASTVTMQLARRMYHIPSQTVGGKLKQIAAALWLEARYGKRDILEAYLNIAPYGGNIEGVDAASLIYFHKRAQQLTLPEALTLAVIPQNPGKRGGAAARAGRGPELSIARRRLWERWRENDPDAKKYEADINAQPLLMTPDRLPFLAPHLAERLLREKRSGEIWSSIDMHLQVAMERILTQYVESRRSSGIANASAMLLDRATGEVRALIGSADYFDDKIQGQVNGTEAKRSPGSTLKPFIYGLAIDQGLLHPLTILKDAPTSFGPFSPENFDGRFVGPISAQDALVRSRNVPAVAVASKLKSPTLYEFLKSAGVSKLASERHYGLALTLGAGEVTMEELVRMYLMLANRGFLKPVFYEKNSGTVAANAEMPQLLSEEAAFIVLQMLNRNVRPDTGEPAAPAVAWKTGTSWGFRDAWTAGVFGSYVMVVWIGNFDGSGNPTFVGVQSTAPLFFRMVDGIRGLHLDAGEPEVRVPAGVEKVEVCTASGDLPNAYCKDRSQTWFIPGRSPIKVSTLHRPVRIDIATGKATCKEGPGVRTEIFEFWPSDLLRLFAEAGLPRRQPPNWIDCGAGDTVQNDGPAISSPNSGVTYTLRLSRLVPIPLRANAIAAQETLFWFADEGWIGKSRPNEILGWTPSRPGRYKLRVVDQEGRVDTRDVDVDVAP